MTRKTPKILFLCFIGILLILTSGCNRGKSALTAVQIKGSDTMVNLGQAWAEEFMKHHPDASIAVTGGGSGTGIAAMIAGTCDVAEVSREMKEKEIEMARAKGIEPRMFKVALDGLAVVVHPENPVSRLTMTQLADIFTGRIANWKDLGGRDAKIVLLSREVNSGSHVYFKEHVLQAGTDHTGEFTPSALLLPSSQAIVDEVTQNKDAIGYLGMGYVTTRQKVLSIARDANSPYIEPTEANVISNSYPISRPLLMYTKGEPQGLVKRFMDFILSPEGQEIVTRVDFVPVNTTR